MVLIDGYVTQDTLFNQAYIDESGLLDLALVERVEYAGHRLGDLWQQRHARHHQYRDPQGGDFNTAQLSAEAGSHDTYRQRATFGKRFANGADLLLSASALAAQGQNLYFRPTTRRPTITAGQTASTTSATSASSASFPMKASRSRPVMSTVKRRCRSRRPSTRSSTPHSPSTTRTAT